MDPSATPKLALHGFSGPLEELVALARAQRIDLGALPLPGLLDQLVTAVQRADGAALGTRADWLVMAAWLVLLRSRLLLPPDSAVQIAAEAEADRLRGRLVALQQVQALAAWLERRDVQGRDVFARGLPALLEPEAELDVVGFLWAAMARFDDARPSDGPRPAYRPPPPAVHSVAAARARILQRLTGYAEAGNPEGLPLDRLLPSLPATGVTPAEAAHWRRAAWAATFVATLELARQGSLVLVQPGVFAPIHASATPAAS